MGCHHGATCCVPMSRRPYGADCSETLARKAICLYPVFEVIRMSPLSIDEMRRDLVARRESLRADLLDVERGLKLLDEAQSVHQRLTGKVVPEPREATKQANPLVVGTPIITEVKMPYTQQVYETILKNRDWGEFGPEAITPAVNGAYGANLTEDQASIAMRNLAKSRKLVVVKPGGPRKRAVYALPETPQEEVATKQSEEAQE